MGKARHIASGAAAAWVAIATPVLAEVVDVPDLLPQAREEALQQSLQRLGNHKADVVFVQGEGADLPALAQKKFQERGLGARDLLIAIDPAQRKVGVWLGDGFRERGIGHSAIQSLLRERFYPLAKQERYDDAAVAFAQGAIQAAGRSPARNANRGGAPAGGYSREQRSGGGFPWGTVLVVGALGGATWFVLKTMKGGSGAGGAEGRVKAMEQAHARIVGLALRLDEVGTLARFAPEAKRRAYAELERQAERILPEAKGMGDAVAEARAAIQGRKPELALQAIAPWEGSRASRLESEVATAITALDGLEREGLEGTKALAMGQEAEALVDRLGSLKARHAQACARAPQGYEKDAEAEENLAEAQRLLGTPPVDLARAASALNRAEKAVDAHTQEVRQALERASRQNDGHLGGGYGFASLPIFIPVPMGFGWGGYGEHHTTVINNQVGGWDAGSSSGAWGGDSGGGGSWGDAGGASDSGGGWFGGDSGGGGSWGDSGGGGGGGCGGDGYPPAQRAWRSPQDAVRAP